MGICLTYKLHKDNLMSNILEIQNLSTGYITGREKIRVASDINAQLRGGEYICLLGPNGAGKTTLLRTLSCFMPPLSGNIYLNGKNLPEIPRRELSREIGVVLTERPSIPSMTVFDLVGLGRSPYTGFWGRLTPSDATIVRSSLSLAGISALKDRLVDTLSDGERQKTMIAKAIAQNTPVIFLDEPTAFLDFPSKADMMRLLRRLAHEQNKIIFMSTHDINMAIALADKLWLLDKSHGLAIGKPEELADNGCLQKYFSGEGISFSRGDMTFSVRPE